MPKTKEQFVKKFDPAKTNTTFQFTNPNNFVVTSDSTTAGVMNGISFWGGNPVFAYQERLTWAKENYIFFSSIAERMKRFHDVLEQEIKNGQA